MKVLDLHNRFKQYVLAPMAKTQVGGVMLLCCALCQVSVQSGVSMLFLSPLAAVGHCASWPRPRRVVSCCGMSVAAIVCPAGCLAAVAGALPQAVGALVRESGGMPMCGWGLFRCCFFVSRQERCSVFRQRSRRHQQRQLQHVSPPATKVSA